MLSVVCLLSLVTYNSIVVHSTCEQDDYDGLFKCDDGTDCFGYFHVCDGSMGCDDGSDEADICYHSPGFNCTTISHYFLSCDDGQCYQKRKRCDGVSYCSNGEDEANCAAYCDSVDGIFCLKNGNPLCVEKRCDDHDGSYYGYVCDDGEDKAYCTAYCQSIDGILCDNSDGNEVCVDRSERCDGYQSCADASDEADCFAYCESVGGYWCDEYLDGLNTRCMNPFVRCDGFEDCGSSGQSRCSGAECVSGAQDEKNCTSYCASMNRFTCSKAFQLGREIKEWNGFAYNGRNNNSNWWSRCLPMDKVCDGVTDCLMTDWRDLAFDGGEDEDFDECNAVGYHCKYGTGSSSVSDIMHYLREREQTGDGDISYSSNETARQIVEITNTIKNSGIDITNHFGLASLLFLNVVTATFIMIGLNMYDKNIGFKKVNINNITFMIVLLEMLCMTSMTMFYGDRMVQCTYRTVSDLYLNTLNWFDVVQMMAITLLWFIFLNHAFTGKCSKYFKYMIAVFTIFLPIFIIIAAGRFTGEYYTDQRYTPGLVGFAVSKSTIPMIWGWLVLKESVDAKFFCCCFSGCCKRPAIWIIICILQFVSFIVLSSIGVIDDSKFNNCFLHSGGLLWFSPIYLIVSILLLFSNARLAVIFYNLVMIIIAMVDYGDADLICQYILNVSYLAHNLLTPFYIVLIFFAVEELKQWKMSLISMYLVSFDVITDIFVIYYFIQSEDYVFAFLQCWFIVLGQIAGSFTISTNNIYTKLTTKDKILSLFGFGRVWFLILSWSEEPKQKYFILYNKHKIWDLMFENLPTVALQMYAALTLDTESYSISIIISIIVSITTMSVTLWMYLVQITKKEMQQILNNTATGAHSQFELMEHGKVAPFTDQTTINQEKTTENKSEPTTMPPSTAKMADQTGDAMEEKPNTLSLEIQSKTDKNSSSPNNKTPKKDGFIQKKFGTVLANKSLFIHLYGYMMSDFYIRSAPFIILISSIPCSDDSSFCIPNIICFIGCFGALSVFEFIMNKKMRIESHRSIPFLLKIFSVSILSSFYSVLCTLDLLKNDPFFGKSVKFEVLWMEHKIRLIVSVFINLANVGLFSINSWEKNMVIIILLAFYLLFAFIHYFSFKYIKQYLSSNKQSNIDKATDVQ